MSLNRRRFLVAAAASTCAVMEPRLLLADAPTDRRLVLVILRGAMDGLSAVPPHGDPAYAGLRGGLAITEPVDLDGFFGLHPALSGLAGWYGDGHLLPVHAVATPYRERSHFDAQDLLENGSATPRGLSSGWLNRALATFDGRDRPQGLAIGQSVPLVLRGNVPVTTWSPSVLASAERDLLDRLSAMYADDPLFSAALDEGLGTAAMAADQAGSDMPAAGPRGQASEAIRMAAAMLGAQDGPRVAVLEMNGWDTHANQGAGSGRLANSLRDLSDGLLLFRETIGAAWAQSAIIVATEFGRTAVPNGTRGTDHGTGAAALLAGGAVTGGRVLADWPGLNNGALFEGRDLRPTLDLRSVLKGVLRDHWGLTESALSNAIFPDSGAVMPVDRLIA